MKILLTALAYQKSSCDVFSDQNGHGEGNYPALGLKGIKLKMTKNGNFSNIMEFKFPVL